MVQMGLRPTKAERVVDLGVVKLPVVFQAWAHQIAPHSSAPAALEQEPQGPSFRYPQQVEVLVPLPA